MFAGRIEGTGPRYCPSIEDKINRFAERDRHQLFVEPEGWNTVEIYLNGFSTSLPEDVQYQSLLKIPGFENVRVFRPGYAIEYDYFPPHQLHYSLETKQLGGLFFAGQINGTTGYEEAACQGLMAGINAHNHAQDKEPLVLKRSEAYIGVLIDDLITKGTEEPYRMFTSRAEFRTLLRQDNADLRLTEIGYKMGLASEERFAQVIAKKENVERIVKKFNQVSVDPETMNSFFETTGSALLTQKQKLAQLVLRPGIGAKQMIDHAGVLQQEFGQFDLLELEQAEIQMKYAVYIEKEKEMVDRMAQMEDLEIPDTFDYNRVQAISTEAKEKLKKIQPRTLGQASRISGINPSDVQILMVYMGR
jgi:tRNA uridine 5-carboxymethylaminomethyl modification enzyme